MEIDWTTTKAAIVRRGELRAVSEINVSELDDLRHIDAQKAELLANTRAFVAGERANHALLWGEMGCGKSTLVRAVFCHFARQAECPLRLVEISRAELANLFDVLENLRAARAWRFVLFCDDFSFEPNAEVVSELKNLLEGSIQAPPRNVIFYATSNRKHLVRREWREPQNFIQEREDGREAMSLSDRFGLWISFYELQMSEYLRLCERLCGVGGGGAGLGGAGLGGDGFGGAGGGEVAGSVGGEVVESGGGRVLSAEERGEFEREARGFATLRGVRSGRVAMQFAHYWQNLKKI